MEFVVSYQPFIHVGMQPPLPAMFPLADDGHSESPRASARDLQEMVRKGLAGAPRGTQAKLAQALRLKSPDITKIVQGLRRVQGHEVQTIQRFFRELGQRPKISEGRRAPPGKACVIGYVGAGGRQHNYDVEEAYLEEIDTPGVMAPGTVAVEIRGNSLGKVFNGGYAFYDDVRRGVTDDLIGRLCIVGVEGGGSYIKTLQRGREPGTFDLLSENGDEDHIGVAVEWAAPVRAVKPRCA